jgi:hypothetical protein
MFASVHAAANAVAYKPHHIDDREVDAKFAVPRGVPDPNQQQSPGAQSPWSRQEQSAGAQSADAQSASKLFVGGLHYMTTDVDFRAYFSQFGAVESAQVVLNRETRKSRGFGFIVFADDSSVDRVMELETHEIHSKVVEVKPAVPRMAMALGGHKNNGDKNGGGIVRVNSVPYGRAGAVLKKKPGEGGEEMDAQQQQMVQQQLHAQLALQMLQQASPQQLAMQMQAMALLSGNAPPPSGDARADAALLQHHMFIMQQHQQGVPMGMMPQQFPVPMMGGDGEGGVARGGSPVYGGDYGGDYGADYGADYGPPSPTMHGMGHVSPAAQVQMMRQMQMYQDRMSRGVVGGGSAGGGEVGRGGTANDGNRRGKEPARGGTPA